MQEKQEKNEKLIHAILGMENVLNSILNDETGCPWDKEQTPHTLSEYMIEECFEVVDAIRKNEIPHVCDEMGDLLFGITLIAKKYAQAGNFDLADVINMSTTKMKRRHPHVFNEDEDNKISKQNLSKRWEEIKKQEKKDAGEKKGVFSSLPDALPPLTKAYRIHAKAAQAGFTWTDEEDVERQVEAEWLELLDAKASGKQDAIEHELGDMFFSLTELGRRMGIKASYALDIANNRFLNRFQAMEALAEERNLEFSTLSLDDKDELWEEVKKKEQNTISS